MMKRLLLNALHRFIYFTPTATCQSGYGAVCKTVYPGSIPGVASKYLIQKNILKEPRRIARIAAALDRRRRPRFGRLAGGSLRPLIARFFGLWFEE
jgi:hypothetical protein